MNKNVINGSEIISKNEMRKEFLSNKYEDERNKLRICLHTKNKWAAHHKCNLHIRLHSTEVQRIRKYRANSLMFALI
jgi:hypothetical protein